MGPLRALTFLGLLLITANICSAAPNCCDDVGTEQSKQSCLLGHIVQLLSQLIECQPKPDYNQVPRASDIIETSLQQPLTKDIAQTPQESKTEVPAEEDVIPEIAKPESEPATEECPTERVTTCKSKPTTDESPQEFQNISTSVTGSEINEECECEKGIPSILEHESEQHEDVEDEGNVTEALSEPEHAESESATMLEHLKTTEIPAHLPDPETYKESEQTTQVISEVSKGRTEKHEEIFKEPEVDGEISKEHLGMSTEQEGISELEPEVTTGIAKATEEPEKIPEKVEEPTSENPRRKQRDLTSEDPTSEEPEEPTLEEPEESTSGKPEETTSEESEEPTSEELEDQTSEKPDEIKETSENTSKMPIDIGHTTTAPKEAEQTPVDIEEIFVEISKKPEEIPDEPKDSTEVPEEMSEESQELPNPPEVGLGAKESKEQCEIIKEHQQPNQVMKDGSTHVTEGPTEKNCFRKYNMNTVFIPVLKFDETPCLTGDELRAYLYNMLDCQKHGLSIVKD
ncbi:hypothetical protein JTB14_005054 [Gonioctena quinquepunctata]|nr:hypothetical protein JTB14_005054 [Gonioctena quinquepunctata]